MGQGGRLRQTIGVRRKGSGKMPGMGVKVNSGVETGGWSAAGPQRAQSRRSDVAAGVPARRSEMELPPRRGGFRFKPQSSQRRRRSDELHVVLRALCVLCGDPFGPEANLNRGLRRWRRCEGNPGPRADLRPASEVRPRSRNRSPTPTPAPTPAFAPSLPKILSHEFTRMIRTGAEAAEPRPDIYRKESRDRKDPTRETPLAVGSALIAGPSEMWLPT